MPKSLAQQIIDAAANNPDIFKSWPALSAIGKSNTVTPVFQQFIGRKEGNIASSENETVQTVYIESGEFFLMASTKDSNKFKYYISDPNNSWNGKKRKIYLGYINVSNPTQKQTTYRIGFFSRNGDKVTKKFLTSTDFNVTLAWLKVQLEISARVELHLDLFKVTNLSPLTLQSRYSILAPF